MLKSGQFRSVLSTALVAILTGCAAGVDYQTPVLPENTEKAFSNVSLSMNSEAQPARNWWQLYQDDTLDDLVQRALAGNTDLRIAEANLSRARAIYLETGSALYPSTDITGGAQYNRDQTTWSGLGTAPEQWTYSAGLGLSYEVDLFGRIRRYRQAAKADMEAEAAALDTVRLVVVAETTRAYVDSCTLGKSIEVAKHSVQLATRSLQLIRQREQVGAAMRLDVERAQASLARAEAALAPVMGQHQQRLLELSALMGLVPAQVPLQAQQCKRIPEYANSLPVGNGAQLLRRRPDVLAAERQLAADTARIGIAVANLYPSITLGASANYLSNDHLRGDQTWSFGIGPLISWHFPNQIAARAQVEQAETQTAASLARFDGTVLQALKETEQALADYNAAMKQRSALMRSRDHADNAFKLAQQRYQSGVIDYLNVLVAQASLIDAEAELIAAEQRLGSHRVSVFLALGGGWEQRDDNSQIQQASLVAPRR